MFFQICIVRFLKLPAKLWAEIKFMKLSIIRIKDSYYLGFAMFALKLFETVEEVLLASHDSNTVIFVINRLRLEFNPQATQVTLSTLCRNENLE